MCRPGLLNKAGSWSVVVVALDPTVWDALPIAGTQRRVLLKKRGKLMSFSTRRWLAAIAAISAALLVSSAVPTAAHPESEGVTDNPSDVHDDEDAHFGPAGHDFDNDGPLLGQGNFDIISGAPFSKVQKNLAVAGRGERLESGVTTDVWALNGYAYTGTFSSLCSDGPGGNESGVWVWDVHNKNKPTKVGVIETVAGSKTNDVKVFTNSAGDDILVMSNEVCGAGGVGGVDIYQVNDPANPVFLDRLQVDDGNAYLREVFGFVDSGIHNIYLWSRNGVDLMGLSAELDFGNFKIYDISDPADPVLLSAWGPEDLDFADELAARGLTSFSEGTADEWADNFDLILEGDAYIFDGFGASANRVMHDLFVNADGTKAYVNFWDAGMILLDISDPSNPVFVSQALDPTSTDGEVNSHSVWTEDDVIVVEGEEDFAPYRSVFSSTEDGELAASVGSINTDGIFSGQTAYVGLACDAATVPSAAETGATVALIQRGVCAFTTKGLNVAAAGYEAMVVFNDEARGDALLTMGGDPVGIPGVFVGHSDGLAIAGAGNAGELAIGQLGDTVNGLQEWNGWSGLRIWDYSDPANPVLASTFDTACSALEPGTEGAEECFAGDQFTYSSHNVVVDKGIAYISWYSDGLLMIDISDPYNPVEVGRYHESGAVFEESNAGVQDIWGVYKEDNSPWVYASDRNGGLYVLKAYGSGSSKNGKAPRDG